MAELGELHIAPAPYEMPGTVLNELVFNRNEVPFPIFGYMDTSLSVIVRFNLRTESVSDLTADDPLNPESYSIPNTRVLSCEYVDVTHTSVRLFVNRAPVYYPNNFPVSISVYGIEETITVASVVAAPQNVADRQINEQFVDMKVYQSGSKAGAVAIKAGDYALAGTNATIRKLVNELFAVKRGEMLHDPSFGNDIKLKGPRSTNSLLFQAADFRNRVMTIPNVEAAAVRVSFDDGLPEKVRFHVRIRTVSGSDVEFDSGVLGG